jgi:rRNA processing protein Gar1
LKIGKITSVSGDDILATITLTKKPLDIHSAKKLIGKPVSLEDSRNANMIGRITNVIGKTDEPYAVISLDKRKKNNTADKVMNKIVFTPFNLDL